MAIYRRKFKDKNGKPRRSSVFTAEFTFSGKIRRRSGFADRASAEDWYMKEKRRLRYGETDFVRPMVHAVVKPLIDEFTADLQAKGRDEMYVYTTNRRLHRLADESVWLTLADVTRESLEKWTRTRSEYRSKPIGPRTRNQYIDAAMEFGAWLAKPSVRKLPASPFLGFEKLPAKHNDQYRRSATLDELNRLLATCDEKRRLYYLFRIYTPIRARTIGKLTWRMMYLDANPPFAKTPAEINKSRREEKHTIRYDVAQQLRTSRKHQMLEDHLVFPKPPTLEDFRNDLKQAGIEVDDGKGNKRLDYHALRRTLVKIGKQAGLSIDQVSLLLGHKSINTTRKYYDEDTVDPQLGVSIEKLPEIGKMRLA